MTQSDCFVCEKHLQGSAVTGGVIYQDDLTYAGHILPPDLTGVYLGYLMIEPKRHVAGWGDLTGGEASALGVLLNELARVLKDTERAEHVYSLVLGDAVPHLHIHLVPRYPDTPREYWGVRIDEWPDAPRGGVPEITEVCDRLRQGLRLIRGDASPDA